MITLRFEDRDVSCKGVIFDKDCTITDSFSIWPEVISRRVNKIITQLGLHNSADMLYKVMGFEPKSKEMARRSPVVVGSRLETAAAVAGILYINYGLPWDFLVPKITSLFDESDEEMGLRKQAIPFPGLVEKIEMLHRAGCFLAVVTNDNYVRTAEIIDLLKLRPYFKAIVCADQVPYSKPNPEMINLVCVQSGLKPDDFVLIGDSLLDIQMGLQAGTKLNVGVLTGACTKDELMQVADCVIPSAADFHIVAHGVKC